MQTTSRIYTLLMHATSASMTTVGSLSRKPVCVIVGAGDATGTALVRRFVEEGYFVVCGRRNAQSLEKLEHEIGAQSTKAVSVDARDEEQIQKLFELANSYGSVDVAIHNIGGNVRF